MSGRLLSGRDAECREISAVECRFLVACCPVRSDYVRRQRSTIGVLTIPGVIDAIAWTLLDENILEALSDELIIALRIPIDDGSEHLNQRVAVFQMRD